MPIPDRYVALQQRQRATEILMQKIEVRFSRGFDRSKYSGPTCLDAQRTTLTERRFVT